jgi:hypothetical protein
MTQCKRNRFDPITLPGENVQNVQKYWDILTFAQNIEIRPHFEVFLKQVDQMELISFAMNILLREV